MLQLLHKQILLLMFDQLPLHIAGSNCRFSLKLFLYIYWWQTPQIVCYYLIFIIRAPSVHGPFDQFLVFCLQYLKSWRCVCFPPSIVGYNAYWVQQTIFWTYRAWDERRLFDCWCMAPASEGENIFCSTAHPKFGLYGYHSVIMVSLFARLMQKLHPRDVDMLG